ncbi:MAG TPA: Rnf-Nqr domain containing protein [Spirochaetia bacterium]|nr:Rnf-Nqr domain containing protein [Spirochaetia bacterium]
MSWAAIVFTFALVDNVVLSRLLGLPAAGQPGARPTPADPAADDPSIPDSLTSARSLPPGGREGARAAAVPAWWLGASMTVLMSISAVGAWLVNAWVLAPLGFTILRTPVMVFLVAGLALALQALARRVVPSMANRPEVSVPRLGVNCVALGLVLVTTRAEYGPLQSLLAGAAAGAGYYLVSAMMGAIRERLDIEQVPPALRGLPLQLITAGLMAYAFMAFDRAFLARLLGA